MYPCSEITKKERSAILQKLVTILLSSLVLTSAISLITLYSPITSKFTLPQKLNQQIQSNVSNRSLTEEKCDLFKGHWVWDPNGSPYNSTNCRFIPDWKNCYKYGRRDWDFVNWRWKPEECELPRFDPRTFLNIVKGKRMMFIGDSVARNQVESLLCLLSQESAVPTEVYSEGDSGGSRTLYFPSHDFTLVFVRSIFLVKSEQRVINGSLSDSYNLYLDEVDMKWAHQLSGTDYAIISGAHWFFRANYLYENSTLIGCTHCSESNITGLGVQFALRRALQTVLGFIKECRDCEGLRTLLRTFSPAHFENGTWNGGGYCNRTSPLGEEEASEGREFDEELRTIQMQEIKELTKEGDNFGVLDVTKAMLARADGHPGIHWDSRWANGYSDCLHWCLPGPIDAWNDLLMAVLAKE